jgi:type 1 glutamine amidotransferase
MRRLFLTSACLVALVAPLVAQNAKLPSILFFANPMRSDNDVIRRSPSGELSVAERYFVEITKGVFEVTVTQDGAELTRDKLGRYDAIVFFTAINPPGVDREALVEWVSNGGAFVGIHSTANTYKDFPPFGEMLGAVFDRRPWRTPEAPQTKVRVKVEDPSHPSTRHLGESFEIADDVYQYKDFDPDKIHILLRLDPASLDLANPKLNQEDKRLPVAWTNRYGKGRVFYTMLGDWEPVWKDQRYRTHLIEGIRWTMER